MKPIMKLPGFPIAQPGETLASVVARHLARSSTPKSRHLKALGLSIAGVDSIVPHDLGHFVQVMPSGHPWDNAPELIVRDHTLVPLFLHFAHPKLAATVQNRIVSGNSKNPAASLGVPAAFSGNLQTAGRFCPDCLLHDLKALGFPIFYRQHQPWFVSMCAVHGRSLHFNCLCRQKNNHRRNVGMWQMAGCCECSQPSTPPLLDGNLDMKTEEGYFWLSRQVSTILTAADPFPRVPVTANLLMALRESGLSAPNGGLDPDSVTDALLDRFSESLLRQLGLGCWLVPLEQRASRALSRIVINGGRIPNCLRVLLLVRLVTDDISDLWSPASADLKSGSEISPSGYGRRSNCGRVRFDEQTILSALDTAAGNIYRAALHLDVNSYVLAADMRYHGIRLPLSAATSTRLGAKRITAIREALVCGIAKKEIERRYTVSEWSILLIELDRPDLGETHREATISRQRERHRGALLSFLRGSPDESRHRFATLHAGSYDWLRDHDRVWLNLHLPEVDHRRRKGFRKARKDWHKLDQAAVLAVQDTVRQELAKSIRPIRLTRSSLLSAAGASAALSLGKKCLYPQTTAEAERSAETKEQFMQRTIRWAMHEYASRHTPISINQLRRVAHLSARQLIENRDYIIDVATELELPFDARCSLAP